MEKSVSQKKRRKKAMKRKIAKKHAVKKYTSKKHMFQNYITQRMEQPKETICFAVEMILVCLLAFVLVFFFGQRVSNAGDAMSPALKNGDIVLVNRLTYAVKKPARGDVIVFRPNGDENAHYSVKRVVGLPGEEVLIQDGQVLIDGEVLVKDIYSYDIADPGVAAKPVKLGKGEYFVLGDHHESSNDSRMADVGNVRTEDIFGKAWFVASFGSEFGFIKD